LIQIKMRMQIEIQNGIRELIIFSEAGHVGSNFKNMRMAFFDQN